MIYSNVARGGWAPTKSLKIETFTPGKGGRCFFKALGHPKSYPELLKLVDYVKATKNIALYDPEGYYWDFMSLAGLDPDDFSKVYVSSIEALDAPLGGHMPELIDTSSEQKHDAILILSFEDEKILARVQHLVPVECDVKTLQALRLPDEMVTNKREYVSPLNFATNFAFFREEKGVHTRLTTFNFWHRYGGRNMFLWCQLRDENGDEVAQWEHPIQDEAESIIIDSKEIKEKFNLPDFTGQLFIHAIGAKGHEIVKYALDVYGDEVENLSCTHDANAWPSDYFAGLPAPEENGGEVILWLQNSHPVTIEEKSIHIHRMGTQEGVTIDQPIGPFATLEVPLSELLPRHRWPAQLEIHAGKYFVRPRYEVISPTAKRCIAHVNVERGDLKYDLKLKNIQKQMGKGFLLPAPLFNPSKFSCAVLPTPMSTAQNHLPLKLHVYTKEGEKIAEESLGKLSRDHEHLLDVSALVKDHDYFKDPEAYGHMELMYDFEAGSEADGWLHAIFRYEDLATHHRAETSFGSHIFNHAITYKNEPQSYSGTAPGLKTRLFLRVFSKKGYDSFCHLVYPVSKTWHQTSQTTVALYEGDGSLKDLKNLEIKMSGSHYFTAKGLFGADVDKLKNPYILISDSTCRLFGYHGVKSTDESAFSLDHMFGC